MEKVINNLREKKPETFALVVLITSTAVLLLCSVIAGVLYSIIPAFQERTVYLAQLFVDFFGFIFVYFLVVYLGYQKIYKEHKVGLFRGLIVGGYFLVNGGINIAVQLGSMQGISVQPTLDIIIFVLTMLMIGLTEEFLCRGVIANLILDCYGKTAVGIKYSVVVSGIIFGLFHMSNALGGNIEVTGVLVQVLVTSAMGMFFTAIYIRTKNIWVVVLLHAFNDFAALLSSGVYYTGTIQDTISSYSSINLLGMLPFLIATCFLLRRSKVSEILEITEDSENLKEVEKGTDVVVGYMDSNIHFAANTSSKLKRVLIGYVVMTGLLGVLLTIKNPLLLEGIVTMGSGSYYNMDAISNVEIPISGGYEFQIEVEDIGFPVVVDAVITDSVQNVFASNIDTYTKNNFQLNLDKGSYIIAVYIMGDQKALQEHINLGLYPYDDEEIEKLMQTLPEEKPESYGAKITTKVTQR